MTCCSAWALRPTTAAFSTRRTLSCWLWTKWLYPGVAEYYRTNWRAVERSIRTLIAASWPYSRALLEELARHELAEKPRPAQFIGILANHLSGEEAR